jgi:hypothetical protein
MANHALFVGWGTVVRGREQMALQVFRETVEFWGRAQQDGRIESFEPIFLEPHGGDLVGFFLVRGDRDRLQEIRVSEEFSRIVARAGAIVDGFGVVTAYGDEEIARLRGQFEELAGELAGS